MLPAVAAEKVAAGGFWVLRPDSGAPTAAFRLRHARRPAAAAAAAAAALQRKRADVNATLLGAALQSPTQSPTPLYPTLHPTGDPVDAVLAGLRGAERAFGADTNSLGFRVLRGVGVIQVGGRPRPGYVQGQPVPCIRIHAFAASLPAVSCSLSHSHAPACLLAGRRNRLRQHQGHPGGGDGGRVQRAGGAQLAQANRQGGVHQRRCPAVHSTLVVAPGSGGAVSVRYLQAVALCLRCGGPPAEGCPASPPPTHRSPALLAPLAGPLPCSRLRLAWGAACCKR